VEAAGRYCATWEGAGLETSTRNPGQVQSTPPSSRWLGGGDLDQPMTLTRKGGAPPATCPAPGVEARVDVALVGRWRGRGGLVVEFRADGTFANRRGTFRFAARTGQLTIPETGLTARYERDGDRLRLSAGSETETFTRTEEIARYESAFGVRVLDGAFWYDKACGAWGLERGPTAGWLPAGLDLGGALRADASGGGTGVFINGRQLHPVDVMALRQLTMVLPGRYWVDAMGNVGIEGNPFPMGNLVQAAQAASGSNGWFHRNDKLGTGGGSDGRTSYVMGKDWSVIIGD